MANYLNRCIWTPASSGTGDFVVSAAASNGYTPANCKDPLVLDGGYYHYFAVNGAENEEGDGQYTAGTTTLSRLTIRTSSNSGSKVNFSAAPTVFMGGPTSLDMPTVIATTSNVALYVASYGSDSNTGTSVGTAVTNGTTSTSSPTLHFASVPSFVAANQMVWDATTNAYVGKVSSTGVGTVTLAANASSAVGSGDTLSFASPLLSIQHAINAATGYDYKGTYTAAINVADGTYAANGLISAVLFKPLVNYPAAVAPSLIGNLVTPANCIISNTSWHAVGTQAHSLWNIGGFTCTSTAGLGFFDLICQDYSEIGFVGAMAFGGSGGDNVVCQNFSGIFTNSHSLTITTSSGHNAFTCFYRGDIIVDGSTITFTGSPTYSNYVIFLQDRSIFGSPTWVNANTVSGKSISCALFSICEYTGARNTLPGDGTVLLYDLSIYEGDANVSSFSLGNGALSGNAYGSTNTVIGVSAANALNGSGGGNTVIGQYGLGVLASGDYNTVIGQGAGDALTSGTSNTLIGRWTGPSGTLTGVIGLSDGYGDLELDCLYTNAAGWTAQVYNNPQDVFYVQSSNADSVNFHIKSTDTSGKDWILYSGATGFDPGSFGLFDNTTAQNPFSINSAGVARTLSSGVYGWTSSTQFSAIGLGTLDTGFSRDSAGVVDLGNGTAGDKSGKLNLSNVTFQAGTTSVAPINLTSGTNLTSAVAGATEYDGNALYFSPAASDRRQIPLVAYTRQHATYTLSSSASVQHLFNGSSNGRVTLPTGAYEFECLCSLSSMSSTSGNAKFSIENGTGTATNFLFYSAAIDGAAGSIGTYQSNMATTSATPAAMATASTNTNLQFIAKGTFEVSGAGTVIPSITLANAAAAVVGVGSYFKCWRLGATTDTTIGNWS